MYIAFPSRDYSVIIRAEKRKAQYAVQKLHFSTKVSDLVVICKFFCLDFSVHRCTEYHEMIKRSVNTQPSFNCDVFNY